MLNQMFDKRRPMADSMCVDRRNENKILDKHKLKKSWKFCEDDEKVERQECGEQEWRWQPTHCHTNDNDQHDPKWRDVEMLLFFEFYSTLLLTLVLTWKTNNI